MQKTMHNKGRKNLHKYLSQASSADDVVSSHAYGRVARSYRPVPKRHVSTESPAGTIAGYRDSMVGSINQYRDAPAQQEKPLERAPAPTSEVIGNRPKSGEAQVTKNDAASIERRHHFIEPPKRGFNRFG